MSGNVERDKAAGVATPRVTFKEIGQMAETVAGGDSNGGLGGPSGLSLPAAGGQSGLLCFTLPSFPVSFNQLYTIDHRRRLVTLSDAALLWRTRTTPFVKPCRWPLDWFLKLTLIYESPNWLTRAGKMRRCDVQNLEKLVIDTMFNKWGFDDSMLVDVRRLKVYGPREQIHVTLERSLVQLTEVG